MIILDTDVLIEVLDRKSVRGDKVLQRLQTVKEDIKTTAINLHEILYGLEKFAKPVKEVLLLPVLDYTRRDAVLSSKIELEAERKGITMRRTDAMIAAVAMNNGAALYTFDLKHFSPLRVMGLRILT